MLCTLLRYQNNVRMSEEMNVRLQIFEYSSVKGQTYSMKQKISIRTNCVRHQLKGLESLPQWTLQQEKLVIL